MKNLIIRILTVVFATFFGAFVNMGIITIGPYIIPAPKGADLTTMEGLKASISLMGPEHFIFPFLAHAMGTFAGAMLIGLLAKQFRLLSAMIIASLFFAGGLTMVFQLPSPLWFNITDLSLAYFPMAYLGLKLSEYLLEQKK